MEEKLRAVKKAVIEGDMAAARDGVQLALDTGVEAEVILQQGLIPAMAEVGRLFEAGEYYVPEMLVAARAMQSGLALLKPFLVRSNAKPAGKVVIGTVKGDLHDIGKNLVAMMLEGAGFQIKDLGSNVSPERFIEALQEDQVDILGLSALLTTTMTMMRSTITAIEEAGLRDRVKIIVGGAPVTRTYAEEIGADGYAPDASRAVSLAKQLIGQGRI
jgi:5-methyltetrahydrofolate--homocysteine methyltransferase